MRVFTWLLSEAETDTVTAWINEMVAKVRGQTSLKRALKDTPGENDQEDLSALVPFQPGQAAPSSSSPSTRQSTKSAPSKADAAKEAHAMRVTNFFKCKKTRAA